MTICKNLDGNNSINNINEWFLKCPPQGGSKQWKTGRSAKENAKLWLKGVPKDFLSLFTKSSCFSYIKIDRLSPEYITKFDNYKGGGRNHDILILANTSLGKTVVGIETKVDEELGPYLGDYYNEVLLKRLNEVRTNAPDRIEKLIQALFHKPINKNIYKLRYQLLTSVAGTIAETNKRKYNISVFIVHNLIPKSINKKKLIANRNDFMNFLNFIMPSNIKKIKRERLNGPINIPGNKSLLKNIPLYIGLIETKIP